MKTYHLQPPSPVWEPGDAHAVLAMIAWLHCKWGEQFWISESGDEVYVYVKEENPVPPVYDTSRDVKLEKGDVITHDDDGWPVVWSDAGVRR